MDTLSIAEKQVLMNEVENDGKTAHLYYNQSFGKYVAYGISAYIVERVLHNIKSRYDIGLQMPMVAVDDSQIVILKKQLENIMYLEEVYLQFEAARNYDDEGYEEWAGFLREQYFGK